MVSLSTAQPAVNGDPPELRAPVLGFYEPPPMMHMVRRCRLTL